MTPEERVEAKLREHHACCSPREVRAVLALLAEERSVLAAMIERREPLIGVPTEWGTLPGDDVETLVDLIRHTWSEARRDHAAAIRARNA